MSALDYLHFTADLADPAVVSSYDDAPLWSAAFGLLLFEYLPLSGRRRALDVGCGTGFPTIELAGRLGPEARVCGVDPWQAALARARAKASTRGLTGVTFHEASANALPFEDASFDLIVSNLGVNNFEDAPGAFRECRRVSTEDAVLALTTNLQGHMQELYRVFDGALEAAGDAEGRQRLRAHVAHRATVGGLQAQLEAAGFGLRRVIERTTHLRFADGRALLNDWFVKMGFLDAWKAVVPGREVEIFLRLERALEQEAQAGAGLDLTIPMAYIEASPV